MAAGGAAATAAQHWRALLAAALDSNAHLKHSTYFQLATVSVNGRPANRTVVFRGFQEGSDNILINTDSRTRKIEEINQFHYGEICWYFTESWEQFRINGRIDVIDSSTRDLAKQQQRKESWFASSLKSRLQYLRPVPRLPVLEESSEDYQLDPSIGPLDSFCLLVFNPEQVDYVNLKRNVRFLFTSSRSSDQSNNAWQIEKVNP
ncbi:pyridoxine/pyridoxamine 5'-phosphate oxidase 2 isoform X1 [Phalaenopsis equestris]|uniref:pyridoxine/pyridoxamine 5'-phosphate oxidase 2 isoform X1 n=1 Tax=Phalaenopsis equestris TaxID=78828 RepID=UPI0009E3A7A8|nr:pyridoxine/pyridoxamine 5'-phosphate oxidase 2 isoform X1 [Phalaenopsis equestris]